MNTDYVVLADTGIVLEGADDTVHGKGKVLVLDSENEQVKALAENGSIAPVLTLSEDQLEDFTVTDEFLTENPSFNAIAKTGDVIKLPKVSALPEETTTEEANVGAAPEGTVAPAAEEEVAAEEVAGDEVAAQDAEPVMHYAGQVVVNHRLREVNDREMHHVRLADGSEQDITDEEYETMVKNAQ